MTWKDALRSIERQKQEGDLRNPGSPYVSLYMSRKQVEALIKKLTKPHVHNDRCSGV